jgi:hypothetical protein
MRTTPLTLADTSPRRWWWWPGGVVLIANMLLRSTCVKAESVPLLTSCLPPDLATQFYWAGNVEFTVRLWMVDWRALSHPGFAFTILARAPRRLTTSLHGLSFGNQRHTWVRHRSKPHLHLSLFCLSLATAAPRINNRNPQLPPHPRPTSRD